MKNPTPVGVGILLTWPYPPFRATPPTAFWERW